MAFPNPATEHISFQFYLHGNSEDYDVKLSIVSLDGRVLMEKVERKSAQHRGTIHLDSIDLPSGIYFYQLSYDGRASEMKKIMIK